MEAKIDPNYEIIIREARELRVQYAGSLIRAASITVVHAIRFCGRIFVKKAIRPSIITSEIKFHRSATIERL
jgi:hypothetical protein